MNILILCQKKYGNERIDKTNIKIKHYINNIFGAEENKFFWLCKDTEPISSADFHFSFDMFNYNTQNFVKSFYNFFDLVMLNTCPVPFLTPYDFFGLHSILKKGGSMLINAISGDKIKYETEYYLSNRNSLCPSDIAKEQINLLFQNVDWETMSQTNVKILLKKPLSEDSYNPIIKQMISTNNSSRFSMMFDNLPVDLKNYAFYHASNSIKENLTSKCKSFAENVLSSYKKYDKNRKDIKNIKIYSVNSENLTEKQKEDISRSLLDCFNINYTRYGVGFPNSVWWMLEYKGELSSFLMIESSYTIWNVCTPSNKRKKGYASMLFNTVIDEYARNLRLTVKKQEGSLRLIKFYNSLGFIYRSETYGFYELVREEPGYIDLDLIKIGKETPINAEIKKKHIKKDFMRTTLPIMIYNDPLQGKKYLFPVKVLGSGSSGFVYLYSDRAKKINVTVKQFMSDKKRNRDFKIESTISENLRQKKVNCSIINSRVIKNRKNKIILMDYISGGEIPREVSFTNSLIILKELTVILECLYKKGFIMTDIAPDNILYSSAKKKLVLIDLGSFCEIGKKQEAYYRRGSAGSRKDIKTSEYYCSQNFSVWKLAVFYLELLLGSKYKSWWNLRIMSSNEVESCGLTKDYICYDYLRTILKQVISDNRVIELLVKMFAGYNIKDKNVITFSEIINILDSII